MPPKVKVSKEQIISAALDIVRRHGYDALNARSIASELGCSTQPIFSNFDSMEDLELAIVVAAARLCRSFVDREQASGKYPPYKASGMGYIRFAKDEPALFRLLYMRNRSEYIVPEDEELMDSMYSLVRHNTGFDPDRSQLFHIEMWAFVHGIASMLATGFQQFSEELISQMMTDVYLGIRKQFEGEK
jgi:AcrR family transcriptional regulator